MRSLVLTGSVWAGVVASGVFVSACQLAGGRAHAPNAAVKFLDSREQTLQIPYSCGGPFSFGRQVAATHSRLAPPKELKDFALSAHLAALAYKSRAEIKKGLENLGISTVRFDTNNDEGSGVKVFVAESNLGLFVVYRGSVSLSDWNLNLKFNLEELEKPLISPPHSSGSESSHGAEPAPMVHRGFQEQFLSTWETVASSVAAHPRRPVWVIGHSMGAAVAAMAGYALALKEESPSGPVLGAVVTFSQPRFANAPFARLVADTLGHRHVTLAAVNDPVPNLPPSRCESASARVLQPLFFGVDIEREAHEANFTSTGVRYQLGEGTGGSVTITNLRQGAEECSAPGYPEGGGWNPLKQAWELVETYRSRGEQLLKLPGYTAAHSMVALQCQVLQSASQ